MNVPGSRQEIAAQFLNQIVKSNDPETTRTCIKFLFGEIRRLRERLEVLEKKQTAPAAAATKPTAARR